MTTQTEITLELVNSLFVIDSNSRTGIAWKKNNRPAGTVLKTSGYSQVRFPGSRKFIYSHQVVWMIHNQKEIPEGHDVDHIDGLRLNNDPTNLRCIPEYWNRIRRTKIKSDGLPSNITLLKSGQYRAVFRFEGKVHRQLSSTLPEAEKFLQDTRERLAGRCYEV